MQWFCVLKKPKKMGNKPLFYVLLTSSVSPKGYYYEQKGGGGIKGTHGIIWNLLLVKERGFSTVPFKTLSDQYCERNSLV